jgi:hypothetical protein
VEKIGLRGTKSATARDLLGVVVNEATAVVDGAPPLSFACEEQRFGAHEDFETAPTERAKKPTVRNQPRYFRIEKNARS